MREIVCVIYHDCNREARSMELLQCFSKLGRVHYVSYAKPKGMDDIACYLVDKKNPLALLAFISKAKKVIRKVKPEIVLLHDNDCSVLVPFIKRNFPDTKIVYDSSELYIPMPGVKETRDKSESILLYIKQRATGFRQKYEKRYLKDADMVIAANIERAEIMKEYFSLSQLPTVFDNIHRIDDEFDEKECEKKLAPVFKEDCFNILFAGGIGAERHTYDYIRGVNDAKVQCNLVIAGSASKMAVEQYEALIAELGMQNVTYVGMLTRAQLRYCMRKSQASVVVFDKKSYNTIYCASGKCYEGLFEGIPILASENPPLKRLCEENGVGISDDNFARGIERLYDNYEVACSSVVTYVNRLDYEKRLCILEKEIRNNLGV